MVKNTIPWNLVALVLVFSFSTSRISYANEAQSIMAQTWAPVIMQCAASEADFITAADFDGDWIGNNNWDNMAGHPLPAVVYYDVKETETHWFLFYTLFHPRDYTPDPACLSSCHENDAESLQIAVRKHGTDSGALELMETLAHSSIMLYTNNKSIPGGTLKVTGPVTLTNGHPTVFVEQYGHGIYGTPNESIAANPLVCDVARYLPTGVSELPDGIPDNKVGYALVSIYDTFWQHRDCVGNGACFDGSFDYRGAALPSQIDGDDFGTDSANTPWGYGQALEGGLQRGDWFFDPARAIAVHAGPIQDFSENYLLNPYTADIQAAAGE
jgi:hypothetical protein